ncbi:hypothetical protein OE88DRAFT_1536543 [Heliocybe sulcata]|uniref:Uncharacterized protein n=1 Tax=Heliocybe sulcata TaxID=5364 RepID=A0A5C3N292_9AGAM|nr:hypothetical protein OE88DRAFT_1536543 [Heliocybe sulcata]
MQEIANLSCTDDDLVLREPHPMGRICFNPFADIDDHWPTSSVDSDMSSLSFPTVITPVNYPAELVQEKSVEPLVSVDDEFVQGGQLPLASRVIRPPPAVAHRNKLLQILNEGVAEISEAGGCGPAQAPSWYPRAHELPPSIADKPAPPITCAAIEKQDHLWRDLAAQHPMMGAMVMPLVLRGEGRDKAQLREGADVSDE